MNRTADFQEAGNSIKRAAMGFRTHSGWAVLVTLHGSEGNPTVIQRRRIELVDRNISGATQPYHAARLLELKQAEAFLERCGDITNVMAQQAIQAALAEMVQQGYDVVGSSILSNSAKPLPELPVILGSHPLIHTAEGEFFRAALRSACQRCCLTVSSIRERDLLTRSATVLRIPSDEIQRRISGLRKNIGPPWRQDEKLCALAGWLLLSS